MNINATLLAQMLVFATLIWVTMKYIWPVLMAAMDEREKTIADGLAAGEQGKKNLEKAQEEAAQILSEARKKAETIVERARKQGEDMVNQAEAKAAAEVSRITEEGKSQMEREYAKAREKLHQELSGLIVTGVENVLETEIDEKEHARILKSAMKTIH